MAADILGDLVPVEVVTAPMAQNRSTGSREVACKAGRGGAQKAHARNWPIVSACIFEPGTPAIRQRCHRDCPRLCVAGGLAARRRPAGHRAPCHALRGPVAACSWWTGWPGPKDGRWPIWCRAYAQHAPSAQLRAGPVATACKTLGCPDTLGDVPPDHLKGGRPTFHYRLPDKKSRLDEAELVTGL